MHSRTLKCRSILSRSASLVHTAAINTTNKQTVNSKSSIGCHFQNFVFSRVNHPSPQNRIHVNKRCYSKTSFVENEKISTSEVPSMNTTTTTTTTIPEEKEEYTFQHPKAQQIFQKMIQLQRDDLAIVSELINEKLGIIITQADTRGGISSVGGGNGAEEADDADAAAAQEAKTHADLKLVAFDAKAKIKVIKEVRAITGLGLKEAKEMVEGAPKVVKKDVKLEEAEELKAKLEGIGATIELE